MVAVLMDLWCGLRVWGNPGAIIFWRRGRRSHIAVTVVGGCRQGKHKVVVKGVSGAGFTRSLASGRSI